MIATSLVLLAALLHATWNTLIKFSAERGLVIAAMDAVAWVAVLALLPWVQLPPAQLWPWLVASALLEIAYRALLIQAYRAGDLGLVYPLMRGLSPLVVLGLTLLLGGEHLTPAVMLGIALIPCGLACLLWQSRRAVLANAWQLLPLVLVIGVVIGGYTWVDGQAIRQWPEPLSYLVWLTLISAWPFPLLAMARRDGRFAAFWREQWRMGLGVGLAVIGAYGLVLWAMHLGSVAQAAALREISVVMVVLMGARYLNEPFGWPRLLACCLVLAGILCMKL